MTVAGSIWEVVGGCGADGILVREEKDRASRQAAERLARGATVKALELDLEAGRLHYELVTGAGPESGWVSTSFKGKDLVVARAAAEQEGEETSLALQRYGQRLRLVGEATEATAVAPAQPKIAPVREVAQKPQSKGLLPADVPMDMESLMKNALAVSENDRACVGFQAIAGQGRQLPRLQEVSRPQAGRSQPALRDGIGAEQSREAQAPGVECPGLAQQLAPCARFCERGGRSCNVAEEVGSDEEPRATCPHCKLPIGDWAYVSGEEGAELLHGECMAKQMLEALREEEDLRSAKEASLKAARREEFGIGWKAESVPDSADLACKLGCCLPSLPGAHCLVLDPAAHAVRVAPARDPATAINLEYLAIALQVRRSGGREPLFSLDPKTGSAELDAVSAKDLVQVQRFEPAWLAGTSVGDVMFQADYHLKELSMGEQAQPVVGMRSCMDVAEEQGHGGDWRAREWYIVREADVSLAPGGALLPSVKMGVEARQLVEGPHGLEDARITSAEHPLVKYAEAFTHNFDLIAERKSAVYHLRELAKASVLAKLLLEDEELKMEDAWFDEALRGTAADAKEIPQLWNEISRCQIRVKDGKLVDVAEGLSTKRHGVYGGVQFGVEDLVGEFAAAPLFSAVTALTEEPGQYVSFAEITGGAVVAPRQPRGVDLNLDAFSLSTPAVPATVEPAGADEACGALGKAFWADLDGKADSSIFAAEDKLWLKALFNPSLSDRRTEGERFAPPATSAAHLRSLRALLAEEEAVRQRRKALFLSSEFKADDAGPLFPAAWASAFGVAHEQPSPITVSKEVRTPNAAEAARLQQALKSMAPSFDKSTEDGARFRIYHVGRSEVRTIQDLDGQETIGAVCVSSSPSGAPKPTDTIVKAMEYVEAEESACHYYVVMETETGNFIVTEKLKDGKVRWAANPKHLEARNSLARVTGCVECHGTVASVRDIQNSEVRALLSNCDRKRYARGVFGLAQPACRKCWAGLTGEQRRVAEQLGACGVEGWDEFAADVWASEWWQLSDQQRAAASALGAACDTWDELRRRPEAPVAPTRE